MPEALSIYKHDVCSIIIQISVGLGAVYVWNRDTENQSAKINDFVRFSPQAKLFQVQLNLGFSFVQ